MLKLQSPIYVFGDFHGNMRDLTEFSKILWPLGMHLTPGSFLFLGDYVDRGQYSIEVLSYLFAQKIMLPDKVFMLRGNHELRAVNISFPILMLFHNYHFSHSSFAFITHFSLHHSHSFLFFFTPSLTPRSPSLGTAGRATTEIAASSGN